MIKFLDLHKINNRFSAEFEASFRNALKVSHFILGSNVSKFENEFAAYCGTKHCIGTASGLDALTLILKGYIQLGKLKKGDRVIVPANTYIATILSIIHADLEPVLVEPNTDTYNICPEAVENALNKEVKAIVMVHLYGQLADYKSLKTIADKHNVLLIEDAAQAHGAVFETPNADNPTPNTQHLRAGNLGHAAAFSFYPSKNLGALGDGGAITTNDSELRKVVLLLRNYGSEEKYVNEIIGFNSRLDDVQAAFLSVKLPCLDNDNDARRKIANTYLSEIKNDKVKLPFYDGSKNHVFHVFVVQVADRDDFIKHLNSKNVQTLIHYPIPPHQQRALKNYKGLSFPVTEHIHKTIVSIPMSPVMTGAEIIGVLSAINSY